MDLPTLQAIATRTWGKEDELKALKAELATLDRKITAELAPKQEKQVFGEEGQAVDAPGQSVKIDESETQQKEQTNTTMVAEPHYEYGKLNRVPSYHRI